MKSQNQLAQFEVVNLLILLIIGVVCGFHSLMDHDLGWHLAGGLWMLEHGSILQIDPLGSDGNHWIAYSWFPELIISLLFKLDGFRPLQSAQLFLVLLSIVSIYLLIRSLHLSVEGKINLSSLTSIMLSTLLAIVFLFPVWHLRPQLISVVLFCALIVILELPSSPRRFYYLIPLCILWANIHVYWIFVPLLYFIYEIRLTRDKFFRTIICAVLLLLTACISPYGLDNLIPVWQYAFYHQAGYFLIQEFKPLLPSTGFLFWCFMFVVVVSICSGRSLVIKSGFRLTLLFVLFGLAAFMQRKYLPLFGVVSGIVFSKNVFPSLLKAITRPKIETIGMGNVFSNSTISLFLFFFIVIISLASAAITAPPPLNAKQAELFEAVSYLSSHSDSPRINLLNMFDDGGWIALFSMLAKSENTALQIRTSIDGRTLVMGERKLLQFKQILNLENGWCAALKEWNCNYAILPRQSKIAQALLTSEISSKESPFDECRNTWHELVRLKSWIVAKRK